VRDAERLPLAAGSVQMVFSNLALQWCDPAKVFAEAARVLPPGGLLLF
jgi:malonyl-CoA O-methyltransferase